MTVDQHSEHAFPSGGGTKSRTRLSGRISFFELFCTVVAFSAPVSVVAGFIPFVIIFAGLGAPLAFLAGMVLMLLFAVGFVKMSQSVDNPGAFYAYITAGLGRAIGLGAAFLAVFGYVMFTMCTFPFFSIHLNSLVVNVTGGHEVSWVWYGLVCWAMVGTLSYFRIDLSSKVLAVAMVLEVLIVMVFNVSVLHQGGPEGNSLVPLQWSSFASGSVGVAILFAISCFMGFESTAIYRDEVINPKKNIPRVTYLAILAIAIFYAFSAWVMINSVGISQAVDIANKNPGDMFSDAMLKYVGYAGVQITHLMLVTSIFAAALSGQNVCARYLYTLGQDGVLPSFLGRKHPKHGSPYMASMTASAIWFVMILAFGSTGTDPALLYARVAGIAGFAILVLLLFTSVAVLFFFARAKTKTTQSKWGTVVAPSLTVAGLCVVVYLAIVNFDVMIGGTKDQAFDLQIVTWGFMVVGTLLGLYYKFKKPVVFNRIGSESQAEFD